MKQNRKPTMPVPEAGRHYYGLGRNASYEAARRGQIPTIRIGGRIFAVVAAIERQLAEAGGNSGATRPTPSGPKAA